MNSSLLIKILLFISIISVFSAAYIFIKIGVPILSDDLFYIRSEGFKKVSHYSLFLLRNIGVVFLFYFLYSQSSNNFIRYKKLKITLLFVTSSLLMLSTAGRADIIFIIIPFIISWHYGVKKITLPRMSIIVLLVLAILMVYNFYRLFQHEATHETLVFLDEKFDGNILFMFGYHFLAQMSLVGVTFRDVILHVPYSLDYFNGTLVVQTLSTFLPGHQSPPGELIKEAAGLTFTGGQANLTLLGDFYADFGLLGIVFGMFLLGYFLSLLYRRYVLTNHLSFAVIYVYSVYSLIVGVPGGLFSQAIRYYYLLIIILIIVLSRSRLVK